MSVRAKKILDITCVISNDVKDDIITLLLNTCQKTLKHNMNKKFMNPTFPNSDILIPDEWTLIITYNVKSRLTWLNRGMVFSDVKELLKDIYLDIKKDT
jgi:hypothetical protein